MTYVIGICGASCSGKSTLSNEIKKVIIEKIGIENLIVLNQDWFYIGGDENKNYDEPAAIEWELFESVVRKLINDEPVEVPIYNFKIHKREIETLRITPAKVLIIEGILIFSVERIRNLCNLKVFVEAYPELRYLRRIERDQKERARAKEEISNRYFTHVLPSVVKYVDPSKFFSDIILMNNIENEFIGKNLLLNHIKMTIL